MLSQHPFGRGNNARIAAQTRLGTSLRVSLIVVETGANCKNRAAAMAWQSVKVGAAKKPRNSNDETRNSNETQLFESPMKQL